jgi:hypothetical protein
MRRATRFDWREYFSFGAARALIPGLTMRLYLLGFRSGALAVEIDDVDRMDLAGYSRVVEQFRFGT